MLLLLVCPLWNTPPGSADPLRPQYTGNLLVVVEGPAAEVNRATEALSETAGFGADNAPTQVLFDTQRVVGDDCPDSTALVGPSTSIRRVLMLPAGRAGLRGAQSPREAWNEAYGHLGVGGGAPQPNASLRALTAGNVRVTAIEPDLIWIDDDLDAALAASATAFATRPAAATHEVSSGADDRWPLRDPLDWHLRASQLSAGRAMVEDRLPAQQDRVTIAHFDTGFSPCKDGGLPPQLSEDHSWDFSSTRCDQNSCDPTPGGKDISGTGPFKSRGHGTGTISILAGGSVHLLSQERPPFEGALGGAPFANVVEYRLADSVAIWHPSVVANALRWAASHEVDVVSMSMGGPPNFTLHQAVNHAYCKGVAMFTAAGNNFRSGLFSLSTPRTTVFPARYDRVVAVGGVTAETLSYAHRPWRWVYLYKPWTTVMQGNVGPEWVMDETIVAWTPNVPWLVFRDGDCTATPAVRVNGAGTSAATPQVAAAAAQWLQYHHDDTYLRTHWRSWQMTEAVYRALLDAADKTIPSADYNRQWFGAGVLQAAASLERGVPGNIALRPRARLGWDWIASILLGDSSRTILSDPAQLAATDNMLRTEISQLMMTSTEVAAVLGHLDPEQNVTEEGTREAVLEVLAEDPLASEALKALARAQLDAPEQN